MIKHVNDFISDDIKQELRKSEEGKVYFRSLINNTMVSVLTTLLIEQGIIEEEIYNKIVENIYTTSIKGLLINKIDELKKEGKIK